MDCPQCKTALVMADRQGVEIDHCPNCRGVWLDRGELDKIVERSAAYSATHGNAAASDDARGDRPYAGDSDVRSPRRPAVPDPQQPYPHGYRRRKSFWEELFD